MFVLSLIIFTLCVISSKSIYDSFCIYISSEDDTHNCVVKIQQQKSIGLPLHKEEKTTIKIAAAKQDV